MHGELKRGVNGLATVVSTAPWLGVVGTLVGIYNSFPSMGAEKTAVIAIIFERLSQAFLPCAFRCYGRCRNIMVLQLSAE
jgi:biopolymer transport protein ExbB/TolQ